MILSAIFGRSQSDLLAILVVSIATIAIITRQWKKLSLPTVPVSVNYHFTRECNKTCGFCFHTEKSSFVESKQNAQRGLRLLKEAGMRKINFAGGEPFLYPRFLGELCQYCKTVLHLESVSIITNGTKITPSWLQQYGEYVDVRVSCDSFNEQTNIEIGRGSGENVRKLFQISQWCRTYGIKFKLNTVVCKLNCQEDMAETVERLAPFRWKCFQVLLVEGENDAADTELDVRKRNAKNLMISDEEYEQFCSRHRHLKCFVPEPNNLMASSYLILDEYMRFLDKGPGYETASPSILEVGVAKAMEFITWDAKSFRDRGGTYDWSKKVDDESCRGKNSGKELEW
ncbi:hypothetical protein LTR66_009208 [Elasticomyces elasticus]|nr:hypothetical protein LTR66_009208 [Elasticomyces elasticus]